MKIKLMYVITNYISINSSAYSQHAGGTELEPTFSDLLLFYEPKVRMFKVISLPVNICQVSEEVVKDMG